MLLEILTIIIDVLGKHCHSFFMVNAPQSVSGHDISKVLYQREFGLLVLGFVLIE